MSDRFRPFMSLKHLREIEKEGPPLPRSYPNDARRIIHILWDERNSQTRGKIIWFRAFLLMAAAAIAGWAL